MKRILLILLGLTIAAASSQAQQQDPNLKKREDKKSKEIKAKTHAAASDSIAAAKKKAKAKKVEAPQMVKPQVITPVVKKDSAALSKSSKKKSKFLPSDTDSTLNESYKGSVWQVFAGYATNNAKGLGQSLNESGLFGPDAAFKYNDKSSGNHFGLTYYALYDKGIMLGGTFNYLQLASQGNKYGNVDLSNISLSVSLAKAIVNKGRNYLYPYIGVGFSRYMMKLTNAKNDQDIKFDAFHPIKPGQSETYTANYPYFDLGLGYKRAFGQHFNIGFEAGVYFSSLIQGPWISSAGDRVDYKESPGLGGYYGKLVVELKKSKKARPNYIRGILDSAQIDSVKAVKRAQEKADSTAKAVVIEKKKSEKAAQDLKKAEAQKAKDASKPQPEPKPVEQQNNNNSKKKKTTDRLDPKNYNGNAQYFNFEPEKKPGDSTQVNPPAQQKIDKDKKKPKSKK